MAGPSWQLLWRRPSGLPRALSSRDVARGGRVGRARPPRAGRLVLAARALLLVPRVDRFGLHAAAMATRRSVRALYDLPAALPPVEVDAPLQRLRRVSNACCSNPPRTTTRSRPRDAYCHTGFSVESARLIASPRSCLLPRRRRCACAIAAPSRRRTRSTWDASARATARAAHGHATMRSSPSTRRWRSGSSSAAPGVLWARGANPRRSWRWRRSCRPSMSDRGAAEQA